MIDRFFNKRANQRPYLIPFFTDTHPNSTVGIVPPGGIPLDDGGHYRASKVQLDIWDKYMLFWDKMAQLKKELDAICYPVFGGDGTDDNKYSKYQLATVNEATIVKTAEATFQPMLNIADKFFYVRGTEAHGHGSGALEELIARNLGAEKCDETGNSSRWYWEHELHGVKTLFSHHPFSSSWMPWTEGGGALRTAKAIVWEYRNADEQPPDIAAFGHVHHFEDSGNNEACRVFYSPSWTVAGAFVHRRGRGWAFSPMGALWYIIHPDGRWEYDRMTFKPRRNKPWTDS
jgi:hypothetical protein